jgi:hypothetical protein
MILRLHAGFGIPADLLVGKPDYKATSIVKPRIESRVWVKNQTCNTGIMVNSKEKALS